MDESVSLVSLSDRGVLVDVEVVLSVEVPVVEVEREGDGVGSSLELLSVGISGVSIVVEIGGLLSVSSSSSEDGYIMYINNFENQLTFTETSISVTVVSLITHTVRLVIEPYPIIQTSQAVVVAYIREM